MEVRDILSFVGDLSVTALLILAGYGGLKRLWVFGWTYEAKDKEAVEWKGIALDSLRTTKQAVNLGEAAVGTMKESEPNG